MHIILGDDDLQHLEDKYTVLEVDQVRFSAEDPAVQAYCVMENIPVGEMSELDQFTNLHHKLMENYRKRDWNFCEQALEHLTGKWGGQMDTFYAEMLSRVAKYKQQDPGDNWDPALQKF